MVDDQDNQQPNPTPNAAPSGPIEGILPRIANAVDDFTGMKQTADSITPTVSPIDIAAGAAGSALAGPLLDAVGSSAVQSLIGDEAGVLRLSGNGSTGTTGAADRIRSTLGLGEAATDQQVANQAAEAGLPQPSINSATSRAGRSMPSATPKGSYRPKRMADGGATSPASYAAPVQDGNALADAAPTVPLYDISGQQPVLGDMHPDDVHAAVASGKFSFPKGTAVPVFNSDGQLGDIPAEDAPNAFNTGYRYATPDAVDDHNHSTLGQQALSGVEGVAKGIAGPLAPAAEIASGLTTGKDITSREKNNPWTYGIGEAAGLVGSTVAGVGEGALLADAGELAAKVLGPKAATTMTKIGAKGISEAAQMALYNGGNEVSKLIQGDPNQSVGSAMTNIGLGAAIGGGVGIAFGAVSPLWKATVGDRVGKLINDFKGQLGFLQKNPELNEALTKELTDHYIGVKSAADEVYGANGIKAQGISAALPEMHEGITSQVQETTQNLADRINKMKADPYSYPPRLATKLQADLEHYIAQTTKDGATPADIFNAGQDLKQKLQGYSKYSKLVTPIDEGYDFIKDTKSLAHDLRTGLEDTDVWGKAGDLQQKINKGFTDYLPSLKDFESRFTTKVAGEPQIDPGKVSSYLNSQGKASGEIARQKLSNFLDASEKYKSVISDVHQSLGSESPIQPSDLSVTNHTLEKLTPGAKLANSFVKYGANHLAGEGLGIGTGAAVGSAFGAPGLGALVGEHALVPFFKSVLPGIAKGLYEKALSVPGAKAVTEYGLAVAKGEAQMNSSIKTLLKSTADVSIGGGLEASETARNKLDKQLQSLQQDPSPLMNNNSALAHYMPEHAAAMGAATATAVNYLNNLRPNTAPQHPLSSKLPPNPVAQSQYNRALDIANNPLVVMNSIASGRITPHDVVTLHTVNPGAYQRLSTKLYTAVMEKVSKGETVPYKTRLGLSMFLGQPLDSTMTPQGIQAAQPVPPQPQQPTPTQGGQRPKTSTTKLGGIAKDAKTKTQAAEGRSVAGD